MKTKRSFTVPADLSDWLDTFPAGKASTVVSRALAELKDRVEGQELVLIRGLPGSGKSTMAREQFPNHVLVEADQYFVHNGEYRFNPKYLPNAHQWCQSRVVSLLDDGHNVVVANTFTTREELEPYHTIAQMSGVRLRIVLAPFHNNPFPSVHGVPPETIDAMRQRWEH